MRRNKDVFAWSHRDILGIDPEEVEHCLNIDPLYPPIRQKQRRFTPEQNKVISDEVDRLFEIDAVDNCKKLRLIGV